MPLGPKLLTDPWDPSIRDVRRLRSQGVDVDELLRAKRHRFDKGEHVDFPSEEFARDFRRSEIEPEDFYPREFSPPLEMTDAELVWLERPPKVVTMVHRKKVLAKRRSRQRMAIQANLKRQTEAWTRFISGTRTQYANLSNTTTFSNVLRFIVHSPHKAVECGGGALDASLAGHPLCYPRKGKGLPSGVALR